jgi:gamma-glutamyltranspeptidase/glutathione hydrolase
VLSHVIDRNWDPAMAVMAPRINCQRNGLIQLEGRFSRFVMADLEAAGWPTQRYLKNYDSYFGRAYLLMRPDAASPWTGVADPRGDGGTAMTL